MEAVEPLRNVELSPKAVKRFWIVGNGRYRVNRTGDVYCRNPLFAYYFGHLEKCNFFFAEGIDLFRFAF